MSIDLQKEELTTETRPICIERRLRNGLWMICHPDQTAPILTLDLIYRVGSRYEEPGKTGYAHLFEHLMFDGSEYIGRGEYDRYCTMVGGENNAWTSPDLTNYWLTLPADNLEMALWLESGRMSGFGITQESLDTQKSVVTAEKRQVIDNVPYGNAGTILRELLFPPTHPYCHEPIGKIEDVEKATLEELRDFHGRFYVPENAILVLAGAVDPEETLDKAEEYFGEIKQTTHPPLTQRTLSDGNYYPGSRRIVADPITPLPAVFLGWRIPDLQSNDLHGLELLSMILADGDSSRFRRALEYQPLIASETSAFIEEGELGSIFSAYAIAQNNRISTARLERELLKEIGKTATEGVTEAELMKAKNRKMTAIVHGLLSISERAERIACNAALYDNPNITWNEISYYEKITIDEIKELADRYLRSIEPVVVEYKSV
ncbi:MAG: M16 family metallopeptidase [Candidatus Kapaibacterium sp.]